MESNFTETKFDESIAYLENNRFMGLVERADAEVIKGSAKDAGFEVEDHGFYFNVVYTGNSKKVMTDV